MTSTTMPALPNRRIRRRLNHLPAGLLGCGVVLVVATVLGGISKGAPGALGAAVGVIGVTVSYVLSGLAVAWADSVSPQLTMPVGLVTYSVKFSLLGVLLITLGDSTWSGLHPMAFAIIAAVFGWNAAHIWWIAHAKIPYVEINPDL
jgi:FtsH-binding integral membrane protein